MVNKATRRKILTREVTLCVEIKIRKKRRIIFGIFSCVKIPHLKKDTYMATNAISVMRQKERPAKSQRKVAQRIISDTEGVHTSGLCISRFLTEKSILRELGKWGSKHAVKFSEATCDQTQNSGRKGSIARYYPKVCAS